MSCRACVHACILVQFKPVILELLAFVEHRVRARYKFQTFALGKLEILVTAVSAVSEDIVYLLVLFAGTEVLEAFLYQVG